MGLGKIVKKAAGAVKKGVEHAAGEIKDEYKKKIEAPIVKPVTKPLVDAVKAVGAGVAHVSSEVGDGIDHALSELTGEVVDFFKSESEKDRGVIKRGKLGDGVWFLLTPDGNVRLDSTLCLGVSTRILVTCTTADGKNEGHLYQNKLGVDFSLDQGGHVEEKDFSGSTEYEGRTMLLGTREFRFASRSKSPWTFMTAHIFNDVTPVISVSSEGDVGIVLTAYGQTINIPVTDLRTEPPKASKWKMSLKDASAPYSKLKYDKDGYIDKDGNVKNSGLGCSAFVSVVLHRMQNGDQWLESFNWTAHQESGSGLASMFGLPLMATIPASVLGAPAAREALVKSGRLKADALYMFDVWKGTEHGHVGFILVRPNGRFDQFHYSGMQGYEGLAHGDFQKWYESSMYNGEQVQLYGVAEP